MLTKREKQLLDAAAKAIREANGDQEKIQAALDEMEERLPKKGKVALFLKEIGQDFDSIEEPADGDGPSDFVKKMDSAVARLEAQKKLFVEHEVGKLFPKEIVDAHTAMLDEAIKEFQKMKMQAGIFTLLEGLADIFKLNDKKK
jgi:hypothetical protein